MPQKGKMLITGKVSEGGAEKPSANALLCCVPVHLLQHPEAGRPPSSPGTTRPVRAKGTKLWGLPSQAALALTLDHITSL